MGMRVSLSRFWVCLRKTLNINRSLNVNQPSLHLAPDVLVSLEILLQHVGDVGGDDLAFAGGQQVFLGDAEIRLAVYDVIANEPDSIQLVVLDGLAVEGERREFMRSVIVSGAYAPVDLVALALATPVLGAHEMGEHTLQHAPRDGEAR